MSRYRLVCLLVVLLTISPLRAGSASLLILSKAENTLAIVDPDTLEVRHRIPVGDGPHEVISSADGKRAYVSNYGNQDAGSTLSVIDLEDARELRRVDLRPLRRPHGLAECQGMIYITCEINCVIARYNPASDSVDWIMGTGQAGTHMIALDPEAGRIYTTNIGSDSVTVIDALEPSGGGPPPVHIAVKQKPEGLALSPDGSELWVAPRQGGSVVVIDTISDSIRDTIPFKGSAFRLHFTPDGKRVLASDLPNGELVVIDAASRKEQKRIQLAQFPIGITVSPDSRRAFVSCQGGGHVYAIDLEKLAVVGSIDAGKAPDGLWWAEPRDVKLPRKPGMLGVMIAPLSDESRTELGLERSIQGVVVQGAAPGSPAHAAGMHAGDVIVSINGVEIDEPQRFVRIVNRARAGDKLKIEMIRGGETVGCEATLAERE